MDRKEWLGLPRGSCKYKLTPSHTGFSPAEARCPHATRDTADVKIRLDISSPRLSAAREASFLSRPARTKLPTRYSYENVSRERARELVARVNPRDATIACEMSVPRASALAICICYLDKVRSPNFLCHVERCMKTRAYNASRIYMRVFTLRIYSLPSSAFPLPGGSAISSNGISFAELLRCRSLIPGRS